MCGQQPDSAVCAAAAKPLEKFQAQLEPRSEVMPLDKAPEPQWIVIDPQPQTYVGDSDGRLRIGSNGGAITFVMPPAKNHWECEGTNWVVKYLPDNPTVPYCAWESNDNTKQGSE